MYLNNCRKSYEIILYFITKESEVKVNRKEGESVSEQKNERKYNEQTRFNDRDVSNFEFLLQCYQATKNYSTKIFRHKKTHKQTNTSNYICIHSRHT